MITLDKDECIGRIIRTKTHFGLDQVKQATEFIPAINRDWVPFHFIDVGANIGTHIVAALLGAGFREATAFEPVPELFKVLQENIKINDLGGRSALFNLALSGKRAALQIELSPHNMGDNRIIKSNRVSRHHEELWEKTTITAITLDSITKLKNGQLNFMPVPNRSAPPDQSELPGALNSDKRPLQPFTSAALDKNNTLVWIDTQGHEPDVFKGAKKLLKSKIPFVSEFWPYGITRAGFSFQGYWKYFKQRSVYRLSENPQLYTKQEALDFFNSALKIESESYSPHLDLLII